MPTARIDVDLQGIPTDQMKYHSMIGGLMYLTASRPYIAFATFACARYQALPTEKHLKYVKRIFHYIRRSINMGLWTEYQLADLFTKSLPKERFEYLVHKIVIIMAQQQQSQIILADNLSLQDIKALRDAVKQVPNANNSIRFTIDRETITYILDMFRDTLQLPVETPDHPFIEPADLNFIQRFLKIVGYEGIVDKRLDENYHFIKDAISLVSMHTTRKVTIRGVLIPERDEISEATIVSLTEHKTALAAEAQEIVAKVQEKILEEDIDKMVDETVKDNDDDDDIEKEKKIDEKDDDVDKEKKNDDEDDDNDDHDDHALVKNKVSDTFITKEYFDDKMKEISNTLNYLVPELTLYKTNKLMKEATPTIVNDAVKKNREIFANDVLELVLKEFDTLALKIIEELFKHPMKNKVLNVHPTRLFEAKGSRFKIFSRTNVFAIKDEAGIILTNKQNDFLLADASEIEEFEDLSAIAKAQSNPEHNPLSKPHGSKPKCKKGGKPAITSPLRYALTVKPTVYVSHIRQFWSTARIETTEEGTQILATVDGILRTVTKSSLRQNIKLQDEEGISSLLDTELFENLTLMGYNISPNQKFTFQKGQFSHQWKYLIHTIMQCLSPKSTGFNEFSINIATALVCLATNKTYNFSKIIFDGLVKNVNNKVSKFLMQYTRRARIAQSSALLTITPLREISQGEAFPTDSGFIADQDRATISKSSTLPYDSAPRVTSLAADEG
nr:ribonuclease H-like domain-containing protein [Tanacetum cinerariifolium]